MPRLPVYKVRITPRALRDLDEIYDYLVDNASKQVAKSEFARLMSAIRGLRVLPYRFATPRTGKPRGIAVRAMVIAPYVVRYRIEDLPKIVQVMTVRHGARRRP